MKPRLRVLVVDDDEHDYELTLIELRKAFEPVHVRVQNPAQLREQLVQGDWDIVICDYSVPGFDAPDAVRVIQEINMDLPVIVVSGTVDEEAAVKVLKAGAVDFLVKGRYARLIPAIERETREAVIRRERREAERALQTVQARFKTLVQSMDELVVTIDHNLVVTGVHGKWLLREGVSVDRIVGGDFSNFLGVAQPQSAIEQARAGQSVIYEWNWGSGDNVRRFQTSLSPMFDSEHGVVGLVGVAREITEQLKIQTHLMVSDRMASVGLLAAGIAHEINNPLSAVTGNVDYLTELLEQGPVSQSELSEVLSDISFAAHRVRCIVRDVKIFSRSKDEAQLGPVDAESLLESTLRMARNEIRHRAKVVRRFGNVPAVHADESRLGQVFLNLIVNAAQSIEEGDADEQEIRISTDVEASGRVVIEIGDTGCGMPQAVIQRLFTPFFTTKPVGVGTGLGLSICKQTITMLGGDISVQSVEGVGTTFRVVLPQANTTRSGDVARPTLQQKFIRRAAVAVLADEPGVTVAVKRMLSREHDVTTLSRASQLVERLENGERFDVILTDLMMPEMTGMELFERLKETDLDAAGKIVFMSGGLFTPRALEFLKSSTNASIEKPFDAERLRALVNDQVSRRRGAYA